MLQAPCGRQGTAFSQPSLSTLQRPGAAAAPIQPFLRGCALSRAPCSPGDLCSPCVTRGDQPNTRLGSALLPRQEPKPSPAQLGRRVIPPLPQSHGTSLTLGSAPRSGGPCSAVQQQQGLGWAEGRHPGPCCTGNAFQSLGSPMPETWIPSCQPGWGHGTAKPLSLGPSLQLQPGPALSCSIPTPQNSS